MRKMLKILIAGILIAIAVSGFVYCGSTGSGNGNETGSNIMSTEKSSEENDEITITIVVMQDQYFIDEQTVTLTQIKEKIADMSDNNITVVLENNYASTKAWDNLKTNLEKMDVTIIEQ